MKKLVLCLTVAAVFEGVAAPLLAPVFSKNAVIQRDVAAPVWGWAEKDETVVLTVCSLTYTAETVALNDALESLTL